MNRNGLEFNESSHILDHHNLQRTPETPESCKSELHELLENTPEDDPDRARSSIPMASFNFINSIIGAGAIGVPYALREAGIGLGLLLVLLVTVVTDYSLVLLIRGGRLSNTNTYQDVMRAAYGRSGFIILTILQFLYPFIAMVSHNVVIGDTITKLVHRMGGEMIKDSVLGNRQFVIGMVTIFIMLPLSLYKNISKLSKVSLFSIFLVIFILGAIIVRGFSVPVPDTFEAWKFADTGLMKSVGILACAYICHHNSFLIYDSMIEPSEKRWGIVTHISILFSMAIMLTFGIAGYATFTGHTQGDLLENYCKDDDLMNVARLLFAMIIMLTYPIECFVAREVIENAVFAFKQPQPIWRHITITFFLSVCTAALAMTTNCLQIVFQINGILVACPLMYLFPPICVLKLQHERLLSMKSVPLMLTAVFGILAALVGTGSIVQEIMTGVRCIEGDKMPYCQSPHADYSNDTIDF